MSIAVIAERAGVPRSVIYQLLAASYGGGRPRTRPGTRARRTLGGWTLKHRSRQGPISLGGRVAFVGRRTSDARLLP